MAVLVAAASPPRALAATAEPPATPPPTPPLEPPPPPLLPPPPPEAAAELPADVLEEVGWMAPPKRRLDVRNHRSRQPARGWSPRSGPISRSDVRPFRGCFFFAAAFAFGDAALSIR